MSVGPVDRQKAVREARAARTARRKIFPNHLFADPAWDILLGLYAAALEQGQFGLAELSTTGLSTKQLLPWIDALSREGLVATCKTAPPTFRLTLSGLGKMEAFFSSPIDTSFI